MGRERISGGIFVLSLLFQSFCYGDYLPFQMPRGPRPFSNVANSISHLYFLLVIL